MRILIITQPFDVHAEALSWALKNKGHEIVSFYPADFPTRQQVSLNINNSDGSLIEFNDSVTSPNILTDEFDLGIVRRNPRAVVDSDIHPSDQQFALNECQCV